jgi:hypothetical protein
VRESLIGRISEWREMYILLGVGFLYLAFGVGNDTYYSFMCYDLVVEGVPETFLTISYLENSTLYTKICRLSSSFQNSSTQCDVL